MIDQTPILPVDDREGIRIDPELAFEIGQTFMEQYAFEEPFPHAVLDHFLPESLLQKVIAHFPKQPLQHDKVYEKGYGGTHKRQIMPADCDAKIRELFAFFNSPGMLRFLEGITNIQGLIPDPYFAGGGLHETSRGGLLGIHADFRVNESLQLIRRVNVLIYLNPDWKEEYGGMLELWDKGMQAKVKSVAPLLNRCVIFNTDSDSFHGHPDPLNTPEGITRRSIALYYYTALPIPNASGESRHTHYVARPNDDAKVLADVKKLDRKRQRRAKKMFHSASERSIIERLKKFFS